MAGKCPWRPGVSGEVPDFHFVRRLEARNRSGCPAGVSRSPATKDSPFESKT